MGYYTTLLGNQVRTYNLTKACSFVNQDFPIRNSSEELRKLLEQNGVDEATFKQRLGRQNAANAGNWLNGNAEISRDAAIKILIVLNITDVTEIEDFLMHSCGHSGLYARDYKDIVYRFCLENVCSLEKVSERIEQMNRLIKEYKHLDTLNSDVVTACHEDENLTKVLFDKYENIKSEADLANFFDENKDYFGSFNRTAHKIFMKYYKIVVSDIERNNSENNLEKYFREEASLKEICNASNNIPRRNMVDLNSIQKIIAKDNPNEGRLSNIIRKQERVPRKYLLLFFLMTWGEAEEYKEAISELNSVLDECGMPRLDSRSPYDWLVMNSFYYSSKPNNKGSFDRMQDIINKIFNI